MSTVDFLEGWEPVDAGSANTVLAGYGWSSPSGSGATRANIVTGEARNGTKCMELQRSTSQSYSLYSITPLAHRGLGVSFKYDPVSTLVNFEPIAGFVLSDSTRIILGMNASGYLCIFEDNVLVEAGTVVIPPDVYQFIELSFDANDGSYTVRLNETEDSFTGTVAGISSITCDRIILGYNTNVGSAGSYRYVDGVYTTTDGTLLGDATVVYGIPDADGSNQDFTPSSGVDGYAMIDNIPPNPAEYIEATTGGDISDFDLPTVSPTPAVVHAVMAVAQVVRTGATIEEAALGIESDGNLYFGSDQIAPQTTPEWIREVWNTDPATAAPWSPSAMPEGVAIERAT